MASSQSLFFSIADKQSHPVVISEIALFLAGSPAIEIEPDGLNYVEAQNRFPVSGLDIKKSRHLNIFPKSVSEGS
jgi:hypothetical protein